jgi:hypothetical protein
MDMSGTTRREGQLIRLAVFPLCRQSQRAHTECQLNEDTDHEYKGRKDLTTRRAHLDLQERYWAVLTLVSVLRKESLAKGK